MMRAGMSVDVIGSQVLWMMLMKKIAIRFVGRSAHTTPKRGPLPGVPLSTKYGRQSTEGGTRGGRLSVDDACNQEPDADTRHRDSELDRFGPSGQRNTLRPVSLVYYIEMYTD